LITHETMKQTPFYHYDMDLLERTLQTAVSEAGKWPGWHIHYAIKANANPLLLERIKAAGIGIDCVSGGEIKAALNAGFPAQSIVFAGVGKADWEIGLALDNDIWCFNVESEPELEVIDSIACGKGKRARVALRVNPDVDAHTHSGITTGLAENKFGINIELLPDIIAKARAMRGIELTGLHFHIGSQILDMKVFDTLAERINQIQDDLEKTGFTATDINVGGGLGVDYEDPQGNPIPDFKGYFSTFSRKLRLRKGQQLHTEPGRSLVAQCGRLITEVLYVKKGTTRQYAIVDAGMTDLVRPAMYGAYHRIVNLSSDAAPERYDVVGPVCESSDTFGKDVELPATKRGDYLAILSAGAYGESMASQYNLRELPRSSSSME